MATPSCVLLASDRQCGNILKDRASRYLVSNTQVLGDVKGRCNTALLLEPQERTRKLWICSGKPPSRRVSPPLGVSILNPSANACFFLSPHTPAAHSSTETALAHRLARGDQAPLFLGCPAWRFPKRYASGRQYRGHGILSCACLIWEPRSAWRGGCPELCRLHSHLRSNQHRKCRASS